MAFNYIFILDLVLGSLALYLIRRIFVAESLPLPPGPKGLPLVGNILDMPSSQEWLTFAKWGEKYGDICSVKVLGQPIVVLNSVKAAVDLLDKKSSLYSDRPVLQMGGELVGWKQTLVLLPYGDRFRRFRKLFHGLIGSPHAMKQFHHAEELESRRFLRLVLAKPNDLSAHIRKAAGALILRITHGYEVKEVVDPFVQLADLATEQFSLATAPGGFLVDVVPWLRHVPEWLPGTEFKRTARAWAMTLEEMVNQPYAFVKEQMSAGIAEVSFTSSILEGRQLNGQEEYDLKWAAASMYSGGSDTTVSSIYAFFLAMVLYPDVAKQAQAELDRVVGNDRLPTFSDRENLPYVDALVKELFRWHSVTPTAVPHRAMQDDIHQGYFIPKGTLIFANVWKMTHDHTTYKDPMSFNPDRFLGLKPELDPRQVAFGFGRRSCPGVHLADASVFIACATSLAVFDITKIVDNGIVLHPECHPETGHPQTTGTISHPVPFPCSIKPRSQKAISLILAEDEVV